MKVGPVQDRLLDRAARSHLGAVMPVNFLERRALRRLERRSIVAPAPALPDVWILTEGGCRGREAT